MAEKQKRKPKAEAEAEAKAKKEQKVALGRAKGGSYAEAALLAPRLIKYRQAASLSIQKLAEEMRVASAGASGISSWFTMNTNPTAMAKMNEVVSTFLESRE